MAAMTTALTEYSDRGDLRVYTTTGHTALSPYLVTQTRREPASASANLETTVKVVKATTDSDSNVLAARVVATVSIKYPKQGQSADITAVRDVLRDIVAGDEFANSITTLQFLQ